MQLLSEQDETIDTDTPKRLNFLQPIARCRKRENGMDELVTLTEKPTADEIYMLAGWRQWADAGAVSSVLPKYLIEHLHARKIGTLKSDGFYLFQVPGTQGFLRPEVKMQDGYRKTMRTHKNELYFWSNANKGLVIFLGDEPHLNADRYAEALFDVAKALNVKRVAATGGVYAPVPFDKDRQVSCTYSMRHMKAELDEYAVRFSNYEGGVSLGTYMADRAEYAGMEYVAFYAFVPMYDLSELSERLEALSIERDYKAWYDVMRRINHMFALGLDLSDLQRQSNKLLQTMNRKVEEIERKLPQAQVREFLDKLNEQFNEMSFMPLDDVWDRELGDLFDSLE